MAIHNLVVTEDAVEVDMSQAVLVDLDEARLLDIFEQVQKHEALVTGLITRLYELALQENDYPTQIMLQWFISEQVEEEKTSREVVHKFKMVKDDPSALLDLDRELAGRAATPDPGA